MAGNMKTTAISAIIFLFAILPFIFLVLATTSEPFSRNLQISRLFDADGKILVNMGVLGACDEAVEDIPGLSIDGAQCGRKSPTWFVRASLPRGNGPDGKPVASEGELVRYVRALSLITVPIASGMVGIVLVLIIAAWSGGSKKGARTLNITNFSFYIITTIITWFAFGCCLDLTRNINRQLKKYNNHPDATMAVPLVGKSGNATWLVLTAAILLLLATGMYGFTAARKTKTESDFHVDRTKDIELGEGARH